MEAVNYKKLKPTRDFLQDIAKIIGKVQQVYVPAEPHEWHRGLEVTASGLQTQILFADRRIGLDFCIGELQTDGLHIALSDKSAQSVLKRLQAWVSHVTPDSVLEPELSTTSSTFNQMQAENLAHVLYKAHNILSDLKQNLPSGPSGPILLYPHHFDVSLSWYPNNTQYTFGFSTGDEIIHEPYFYVTTYPEPQDFTSKPLPEPAFWQKAGFSGAVLTYNSAARNKNL